MTDERGSDGYIAPGKNGIFSKLISVNEYKKGKCKVSVDKVGNIFLRYTRGPGRQRKLSL